MSDAADGGRSGRLRTDGIFRRALGDRQRADTEADRLPYGGRTEPTLDDPGPTASEPLPPPEAPLPEPAASNPSSNWRWPLASTLTLLLSVGIGLALLVAPGGPLNVDDSYAMRRWLPSWAVDGLQAIGGRASAPSQPTLSAGTEPAPPAAAASLTSGTNSAGPEASAPLNIAQAKPSADLPDPDNAGSALTEAGDPGADNRQTAAPAQASTAPPRPTAVTPAAITPPLPAAAEPAAITGTGTGTDQARPAVRAEAAQSGRAPVARNSKATARTEPGADKSVRAAPPGSLFIQHASLASEADARAWRARHPALSKARIVPLSAAGKGLRYAVVSGPFTSRKAADAFAARKGVPPKPWLRTQASLQSALPAQR